MSKRKNNGDYKIYKKSCYGCMSDKFMLNQLAHCDPGGCLYVDDDTDDTDDEIKHDDKIKRNDEIKHDDITKPKETCWGCINDESNLEAHQKKGGCEYEHLPS